MITQRTAVRHGAESDVPMEVGQTEGHSFLLGKDCITRLVRCGLTLSRTLRLMEAVVSDQPKAKHGGAWT